MVSNTQEGIKVGPKRQGRPLLCKEHVGKNKLLCAVKPHDAAGFSLEEPRRETGRDFIRHVQVGAGGGRLALRGGITKRKTHPLKHSVNIILHPPNKQTLLEQPSTPNHITPQPYTRHAPVS